MCLSPGLRGLRSALLVLLLPLAACDFPIPTGMSSSPAVAPDLSDGALVRGTLTDDDEARSTGQRRDNIATVTVPAGGSVEVMMESTDFDTYLLVEMVGTDRSVTNDDFNGSRERSVIVQANPSASAVQALIVASAYASAGRGAYEVRYAVRDVSPPPPPVESRELTPGSVSGRLAESSAVVPLTGSAESRRADAFVVRLREGMPVTFRMESTGFDTYLKLDRGTVSHARNDDFEGSRSVSQIVFTPPATGDYTLYAGAYTANATGAYTLSYRPGAAPDATPPPVAPVDLGPGATTVAGTLTDADTRRPLVASGAPRLTDAYSVDLAVGQTLTVVMESTAFDTYLKLSRGGTFLARNDDDGSTQRSTIRYVAIESGPHQILAGTFHDRGRGAYTLRYAVE